MNENLDNLAFQFFKLFAQFESTLKEGGYFDITDKKGNFKVNWDKFANSVIGKSFWNDLGEKEREAAEFILYNPPKKQIVKLENEQNKIIWDKVPNEDKSVQALFSHICRMRNNLFHGAKFNGTWFAPKRSKALLKSGLIILKHYEPLVKQLPRAENK